MTSSDVRDILELNSSASIKKVNIYLKYKIEFLFNKLKTVYTYKKRKNLKLLLNRLNVHKEFIEKFGVSYQRMIVTSLL
jgi:hypothetical protein